MNPDDQVPEKLPPLEEPAEPHSPKFADPSENPEIQEFVSWLLRDPRKKEQANPRIIKRKKRRKKLKLEAGGSRSTASSDGGAESLPAPDPARPLEAEQEEPLPMGGTDPDPSADLEEETAVEKVPEPEAPVDAMTLLRQRILNARMKNLSLLSLSKITSVSYQTVLNFVNGKTSRLSPAVRKKLEEFFHIPVEMEEKAEERVPSERPRGRVTHATSSRPEPPAMPAVEPLEDPLPHPRFYFAGTLEEEILRTQARLEYWLAIRRAEEEYSAAMKMLWTK